MTTIYASASASSGGSGSIGSPLDSWTDAYNASSALDIVLLKAGECFDPVSSFFPRIKKSLTLGAYGLDTNLTYSDKLLTYPRLDGMAYEPPDATGWTYEGDGVWSKPFGSAAPKRMFAGATKTGVLISQRTMGVPYSRSPNATPDTLADIKAAIVGTDDIWHPAGATLDYRVFVYTGSALVNPADYYNGLGFVTADGTSLGGGGNEGLWVSACSGVEISQIQTSATTNGAVRVTSLAAESTGTSDVTVSDVIALAVWNQGFVAGPASENTATLQKLVSDVLFYECVGDSSSAATEQDRSEDYVNTAYLDMFNFYDRIDNVRAVGCQSINSGHTGMAMGCGGNNHFEPTNSGFLRHTVTFASWCTYARGLATSRCGSGCYIRECTIDGQNVRSQVTSAQIVANAWTNMRASQRKPGTDQWLFVESYITLRDIPLAGDDAYVYITVSNLLIANNVAVEPKCTGATNAPFVITTYASGYGGSGYADPNIDAGEITFANNILIDSEARFWMGAYANGGTIGDQVFRNNLIYDGVGAPAPQVKWLGTLYDTNSLSGSSGNLFDDPLLGADLVPQTGSPAIGAGYAVGSFTDLAGNPFAATPSIGAYEVGSSGGGSGGGSAADVSGSSDFGLNINMLRDVDNDPGYYLAACGRTSNWRGAAVYESSDGGTNYTAVTTITAAATIGRCVDALGDFSGGNIPDELNTLTVRLYNGELSSVSYANFLNGVQAAIVGREILYFRNAVQNSDGTYTLSGFLRGRRGSEYAMGSHVTGERFVLASATTLKRITGTTSDIGRTKLYKAVSSGATLAGTASVSFTNDGAGLKPYSPVHIGGGRDADGNLTITWIRRGRISAEWRDSVDVPVGEASEQFEIDILDGETVVRTISATSLNNQTVTYTAAQQVEDFGSAQSSVSVQVFQISQTVGRGYPGSATI